MDVPAPIAPGSFFIPTNRDINAHRNPDQDAPCIYLCGNSLGPLSKLAKQRLLEEVEVWEKKIVIGHFNHPLNRPWSTYGEMISPMLAEVVGAKPGEVACMGALTSNLHLMLDAFYTPTKERYKILCEERAFPSDQYAFASKAYARGFEPKDAVRELAPRAGEFTLCEEDILEVIEKEGDEIAIVLFSGIQYYTGQLFPIERITAAAHAKGCLVGWDLAHAAGNVPLALHDWDVDFAVWCTYKYLNAGPGSTGGLFMHEKWNKTKPPLAAGWWGNDIKTRFRMGPVFDPYEGAQGFQQSTASVLTTAPVVGALEMLRDAGGIRAWRAHSIQLTGLLERLLTASPLFVPLPDARAHAKPGFTIITPADPKQRGAQLSLLFLPMGSGMMDKVFAAMESLGVIGDEREPDVIRFSPNPYYTSAGDLERCVRYLEEAFGLAEEKE